MSGKHLSKSSVIGPKQFEKLCLIAKKHNVKKFTLGEVTIEFGDSNDIQLSSQEALIPSTGMPTEDQMLFWSSETEDSKGPQ